MKRTLMICGILLVLCSRAYAGDWKWYDTVLEVTSETLIYVDWKQTREFTGSPQEYRGFCETNPWLGEYPSARRVNTYFVTALVVHPVVSYVLPQPYRELWQGVTIGVEYEATRNNRTYGVHVQWHW